MSTTTQDPVETKNYDDENFTLIHKIYPGCKHVFEIRPKKEFVKKQHAQAVRNVNKEVSVPGFRKGKAPEQYIVSNFEKAIQGEWKDLVVNHAFSAAVTKTNVSPRNQEAIQNVKVNALNMDDSSEIVVTFEAFPELPEIKIEALKIEKIAPEQVTEEEIEKVKQQFMLSHATWEDMPEHVIQEGDWVVIDVDGTVNGENADMGRDVKLQVLKEQMNPWMVKLLIGKKMGDVVEGVSENDGETPVVDFEPTPCKVTIKKVQKPILPELNQEFADKIHLPSIDQLRDRIKENLEAQKMEKSNDENRELLIKKFEETFSFEVPHSFVQGELRQKLNEEIKKLKQQNLSEEEMKTKTEEFEKNSAAKITHLFRLHMLMHKYAHEHKIEVTEEEVIREMIGFLQRDPSYLNMFQGMDEETMANFKEQLRTESKLEKVLDHILNRF